MDVVGFGVLTDPLTSLKHPSEGYSVDEASLGRIKDRGQKMGEQELYTNIYKININA